MPAPPKGEKETDMPTASASGMGRGCRPAEFSDRLEDG